MHRLLLATDGSIAADAALDVCAALSRGDGADVIVVHVLTDHRPSDALRQAVEVEFAAELARHERAAAGRAGARKAQEHDRAINAVLGGRLLERTRETLERRGVTGATLRLIEGEPAARIVELAEGHGCDAIVIGCRGQGLLGETVLGSVSREVARRAGCRVIVVR